jgi:hypothetical protein
MNNLGPNQLTAQGLTGEADRVGRNVEKEKPDIDRGAAEAYVDELPSGKFHPSQTVIPPP